jgi:hypothetical protein
MGLKPMAVLEQILDEAMADNALLDRRLGQVGRNYIEDGAKLRRAGQGLLELERMHPELAGEIDAIRRYIWPERRQCGKPD